VSYAVVGEVFGAAFAAVLKKLLIVTVRAFTTCCGADGAAIFWDSAFPFWVSLIIFAISL